MSILSLLVFRDFAASRFIKCEMSGVGVMRVGIRGSSLTVVSGEGSSFSCILRWQRSARRT